MDFAKPAGHRLKVKEIEKKNKYLDIFREWKKLWDMKVIVTPFVIGTLGRVTNGSVQGLEDLEIREWVRPSKLLHY